MSEQKAGINFHAPITGDVKVNSADGTWIEGDQTNVQGDNIHAGAVATGKGAKLNATGQVVTFGDSVERPNGEMFQRMEQALAEDRHQDSPPNFSWLDVPEMPNKIQDAAESNRWRVTVAEPTREQEEEVSRFTGLTMVNKWEEQSYLPEDQVDAGYLTAITRGLKRYAPRLIPALLAGGETYLTKKVSTSSVVAAGIAALGELRG